MKKILLIALLLVLTACQQNQTIMINFYQGDELESFTMDYNYLSQSNTMLVDDDTIEYVDEGFFIINYSTSPEYVIDNSEELIHLENQDGPMIVVPYFSQSREIHDITEYEYTLVEGDLYAYEEDGIRIEVLIDENNRPIMIEYFADEERVFKVSNINTTEVEEDVSTARSVEFLEYVMSHIDETQYSVTDNVLNATVNGWTILYTLGGANATLLKSSESFTYQYPTTYEYNDQTYTHEELLTTQLDISSDLLIDIEQLVLYYRQPHEMVGIVPEQ